jgi:hypothetical protein
MDVLKLAGGALLYVKVATADTRDASSSRDGDIAAWLAGVRNGTARADALSLVSSLISDDPPFEEGKIGDHRGNYDECCISTPASGLYALRTPRV